MAQEIERKFLVVGPYKDFATSHYTIRQGYICSGGGRTVRVRLCGERGFLTIKGPSLDGGLSRFEKVRWLIPNGKHTIEVDEFLGENEGLVVAEIELHSPDEPYLKPDFLGQEVTGEARYYNSQLRRNPYKNW